MSNSKNLWPPFPTHIGNYSILNGKHARKEAQALQDLCLCLGSVKVHDPHELVLSHVRAMGFNHANIHVIDFDEDRFKGIFFHEEVLKKLPDDATRQEIQAEKEEMNKFHPNQFLRLFEEDKNKLITKEQAKIKKRLRNWSIRD
jgi:hypothetical protein